MRTLELLRGTIAYILVPGAPVRRWLLLAWVGALLITLALVYAVRGAASITVPDFLPGWWEALPLGVAGILVSLLSIAVLANRFRAAMSRALPAETLRETMRRLDRMDQLARGMRLVVVGGGTGLSTMLRGLKDISSNITGIVTVSDDGGSSGRLRDELKVLPPGDIRNCIVALAEAEPVMKDLFQYRFTEGTLQGHSFGNLFIAAMTGLTGSFEKAISESSRVLKVTGTIMPATLDNTVLIAEMTDGTSVQGESAIPLAMKSIARVRVSPAGPSPFLPALDAIANAQIIVLGPGSLYTSVIPNLLVPGIRAALSQTPSPVIYVCNIATQPGETDGYTVADHVRALLKHCPDLRLDYVLANDNMTPLGPRFPLSRLVPRGDFDFPGITLIEHDLQNPDFRGHHNPKALAEAIKAVYDREVQLRQNDGGLRGGRFLASSQANGTSSSREIR